MNSVEAESEGDDSQVSDDKTVTVAQVYDDADNNEYRRKELNNAIYLSTEKIKVNCKDDKLKAQLYSDRAAAHFQLGNYIDSLDDAKVATDLNPACIEAIVKGASACLELDRIEEAFTWLKKGIKVSYTYDDLVT